MPLPDGVVPNTHEFMIRRVAWKSHQSLPEPCFRFTGSGDRPCNETHSPLKYALAPWKSPVRLDALLLYWSWSLVDVQNPLVYIDHAASKMAFPDHTWVEVARYAQRTSYVGSDGGGYGLWFWLVPGTGVRVNVGRSLRFDQKKDAIKWANSHQPLNASLSCMKFAIASCWDHDDSMFCAAARHNGYDSVMVRRKWIKFGHMSGLEGDVIELILCPIVEAPEQFGACPSIIEYRGRDPASPCTCNASAEMLACLEDGLSGSYAMADDYGTRPLLMTSVAGAVYGVPAIAAAVAALFASRRFRRRRAANANVEGRKLSPTHTDAVAEGEPSMPLLVL